MRGELTGPHHPTDLKVFSSAPSSTWMASSWTELLPKGQMQQSSLREISASELILPSLPLTRSSALCPETQSEGSRHFPADPLLINPDTQGYCSRNDLRPSLPLQNYYWSCEFSTLVWKDSKTLDILFYKNPNHRGFHCHAVLSINIPVDSHLAYRVLGELRQLAPLPTTADHHFYSEVIKPNMLIIFAY